MLCLQTKSRDACCTALLCICSSTR